MKKAITATLILFVVLNLQNCCKDEKDKVPITTSSCEAKENFIKGRELANNLQRTEALKYFEKAIEIDTEFAMAYLGAGLVQPNEQDIFKYLDNAISLANKVSEGERLIILSTQADINNNHEKLSEFIKSLEEKYPKDEYVLFRIGNFYYSQQDYKTAVDYYKKVLQLNKEFAPAFNILGYAYRNLEKYDIAEKSFKQYIKLIPDNPNPYDSYGELLLKMGEYEASLEQYRKAIKHDSNFVVSYVGMATNLVYISDYNEARLLLERYYNKAKHYSDKRRALIFTSFSYVDEGDYKNAIMILERLVKESEKNGDDIGLSTAKRIMSAIYFENGQYEKAVGFFKKSIQVIEDSKFPQEIKNIVRYDVLFGEALIAAKRNDFKTAKSKADEYMKKAEISGNPNQKRTAHEICGRIALDEKKYQKAIEELKQADQRNAHNLYLMAVAYEELNDIENAKSLFEKVKNFNSLLGLDYAFCRNKAKNKLIDLQ